MCGSRSGIIFLFSSLWLSLSCLAPDALAAGITSNTRPPGTNYEYEVNSNGIWAAKPLTASPAPTQYYDPSQFSNPIVDSQGNIKGTLPVDNLPVPTDPSGIPGISEQSLVKVGDLAATLAPYLAQLAALSPQARVAVGGASALYQLWYAYYTAGHPLSSSSTALKCSNGTVLPASSVCPSWQGGPPVLVSSSSGLVCGYYPYGNPAAGGPFPWVPFSAPSSCLSPSISSSPSTASVPAPTAAQLVAQIQKYPADAQQYLQNLPSNVASQIPVTDTTTGPSSFVEPSTVSTTTASNGTTTTTTNTVTDHLTYNGPVVTDSQTTQTVTKVCTGAGSCTTTTTDSAPPLVSPFIAPGVNYPNPSTAVPNSTSAMVPFSFGVAWLPKTCPAAPTFTVCPVGGGTCTTEQLPTSVICKLASGMEPIVTAGGGLLGVLILAW